MLHVLLLYYNVRRVAIILLVLTTAESYSPVFQRINTEKVGELAGPAMVANTRSTFRIPAWPETDMWSKRTFPSWCSQRIIPMFRSLHWYLGSSKENNSSSRWVDANCKLILHVWYLGKLWHYCLSLLKLIKLPHFVNIHAKYFLPYKSIVLRSS